MTLRQLRYVTKITECGSMTEAARQLYISQPSLSAAIKELEDELGIEIFRRTPKGITLTPDGTEFLSYVRQITEQTDLLEQRYMHKKPARRLLRISTQHYAFAVNAFVNMIKSLSTDEYELTLRETRTYEIIEDVADFRSELGILYLSAFNEKVLRNMFKEKELVFTPLFEAAPHVFVSADHPLAGREEIDISELDDYPLLVFEQGNFNSFYFFEEVLDRRAQPQPKRRQHRGGQTAHGREDARGLHNQRTQHARRRGGALPRRTQASDSRRRLRGAVVIFFAYRTFGALRRRQRFLREVCFRPRSVI